VILYLANSVVYSDKIVRFAAVFTKYFVETKHQISHYENLFADVKSAREGAARQFPF
jgi:hypothetical protein